ncbi:MAG: low-specificity L-threonine aldolase [Bacilli bacterium]|nr:low-specificity L-threonine aldolase [Bacilli bacterium]MBN2696606.1 low-specificity L-threonine aldolase [Bacilli bacterium]
MRYIDLRSDTVTELTKEMRLAMLDAPVGDDVFQDDPTMNELEALAAKMLGKEDAVFVPSGTFSNQLALFTHCQQGDEVILDQNAHIVIHESGASSIIAGVQLYTLDSVKGIWDLNRLKTAIKERTVSTTRTRLVCMENAINGKVLPLEYMKSVYDLAKSKNLKVHLDGARIFNAALALGCDVSELAQCADSVSVCLSKGLAAPVGTLLVGDKEFISEARWRRKLMGGGMRQVGILAACGKIALEVMTKRLNVDHENAAYMADLLREIPRIKIDEDERDINMVFFDIDDDRKFNMHEYLLENGVKILPYEGVFRFVTHKDVNREDIKQAIDLVRAYFQ